VLPLSHLTSCTRTKSNLNQANSLAVAVSEPALHRLLTFQVPNLMSLFRCVDLTEVSVQVRGFVCEYFVTKLRCHSEELLALGTTPSWRTTPCRLYPIICSIYSQLSSVLKAVPPSETQGSAMPWWQGTTYNMAKVGNNFVFHPSSSNGLPSHIQGCLKLPQPKQPVPQSKKPMQQDRQCTYNFPHWPIQIFTCWTFVRSYHLIHTGSHFLLVFRSVHIFHGMLLL
jgi:hypothetical protein